MTMKSLGVAFFILHSSFYISSCSDKWDEHYEVNHAEEGTLWQSISSDAQLQNFTRVLRHCGYDSVLGSSQMFTVFAPVDDGFSTAQADSVIALYDQQAAAGVKDKENAAIKEFVRNHVANYNFHVNEASNDSISMLNGKLMNLQSQQIGSCHFVTSNKRLDNGVLFTIDSQMSYEPNVMEQLRRDPDLSLLADFFYGLNREVFVPGQSVPGSVVDGQTVYLDSVFYTRNALFNEVGYINSEDSTYWMLAPTNAEWQRLMAEYATYYNFSNTIPNRDSLQSHYASQGIVRGSVFSMTQNSEAQLWQRAWSTNASIYSKGRYEDGGQEYHYYEYASPLADGGVLASGERQHCSNGQVIKVSHWPISIFQTFVQQIIVEAESPSAVKEVDTQTTRYPLTQVKVQPTNPFYGALSDNAYVEILAKSPSVRPSATFHLPNVLSNIGYDIYVVTVPALAGDTLATEQDRLPTKFRCTAYWTDQNGVQRNEILSGGEIFTTTADQVESLLVASDYKFPTCSYGLSPQVSLKLESRVSNTEQISGTYQRTMRLDCILLVPHRDE